MSAAKRSFGTSLRGNPVFRACGRQRGLLRYGLTRLKKLFGNGAGDPRTRVRIATRLKPAAFCRRLIQPVTGQLHPRMPERLDEEELADWRAGRSAVYQLAALTIGARLAVADA